MISIIKDLFSNQVGSAVILTIIGAITKKYIQFHRRDFFSRSSSEQIKAVEWLRTSSVPISDPLAKAEQQFRLQSFGLHRDWHLSYKIICLSSDYAQSLIPSLKAVLRYQGMYTITNGNIYPHKFHKWIIPFVLISLLLYIGAEIYRGSSQSDGIEILKSLYVVIVAFIVWCWVAACALILPINSGHATKWSKLSTRGDSHDKTNINHQKATQAAHS